MKKLITILLAVITLNTMAQQPTLEWVKTYGGATGNDYSRRFAHDSFGNLYIVGFFYGTVDFDLGPGVNNVTSVGQSDAFILKLDSNGNFLWVKTIGLANYTTAGYTIDIDSQNNLIVGGAFWLTTDIDPGSGVFNVTSNGGNDQCVIKLDSNGNFIWGTSFGGPDIDNAYDLKLSNNDDIYMTGHFLGTVDFDPGPGVYNLTSNGGADIYVMKLNNNGDLLWVKTMGESMVDSGLRLSIGSSGSIYVTGNFASTVDFDPGTGVFNVTALGPIDAFILKLDSNGNFIWVKSFGGSGVCQGLGITTDALENVIATGDFDVTVDFDPGASTYNLSSSGSRDAYTVKLDVNGNFLWAKSYGGMLADYGHTITSDATGNIYTAGTFRDTVDFNPGTGVYKLYASLTGMFVQKLDPNGNFVGTFQIGGNSFGRIDDIKVNGTDIIHFCGSFTDTVDFDPGSAVVNLHSNGGTDNFIIKLNQQCTPSQSTDMLISCDSLQWIDGITYYANNTSATHTITNGASSGCDSIVTLNLTINTVDTSVTQNVLTFTANATGATFQWIDCDNNNAAINGETNASYTATANGNYAVVVTQNGCTDTSACFNVSGVGIAENSALNATIVYPNPSSTNFTIETADYMGKTIVLFNAVGQEVYSKVIKESKTVIEVSEIGSKGVYILKIINRNAEVISTNKLIVE
ncbi:T9SS type A sorting domain-containing protein [Crocinitomicaceae bacterium]|nr:T9SS type A sorting domain-containing protein [Crocinitomicaceae bacterium]